jgi:amphi-Trp domain-containing protein
MDKTDKPDMPAKEGKFSYESVQDVPTLVEYLKALTAGFEKGEIHFARKDLDMVLAPKGLIGFALEAKAKDGRMKLAMKFAWRESVDEAVKEDDMLVISSSGGGE